jgi:circadian clock protein KaiC
MSKAPEAATDPDLPPLASTGVPGLDAILHGGLPCGEMHLVQGEAGTGKTTMALHFLLAGVEQGEAALYITLSQSAEHLGRIARSHGWSLAGVTIHELSPGAVAERIASRQTILPTAEAELGELFDDLEALVKRVRPRRAVIDSISILRLLAGSPQRYHREVVTLRQLLIEHECTVLALADRPAEATHGAPPEVDFHPISGCVIHLEQQTRAYGDVRRHVRVIKARGVPHSGGYHDYKIRKGHMDVYPRLGSYTRDEYSEYRRVESGIASIDAALGGGLEQGTACLVVGPSGTGKSTLAALFADAVARQGDHAAVFLFDERPATYKLRSGAFGIDLRAHVASGRIYLQQVDPGQIAPGEFAQQVRALVELQRTRVVVIDSITGYFNAMGSSEVLIAQLHELLTYLSRSGVLTILAGAQEGPMSIGGQQGVDISYLSDAIVILGYFEAAGQLRRCFTAVKKRHGEHDTGIRELFLERGGIRLGEPLRHYRNILLDNARPADDDKADRGGDVRR